MGQTPKIWRLRETWNKWNRILGVICFLCYLHQVFLLQGQRHYLLGLYAEYLLVAACWVPARCHILSTHSPLSMGSAFQRDRSHPTCPWAWAVVLNTSKTNSEALVLGKADLQALSISEVLRLQREGGSYADTHRKRGPVTATHPAPKMNTDSTVDADLFPPSWKDAVNVFEKMKQWSKASVLWGLQCWLNFW